MAVKLVTDGAALANLLRGPGGPVFRHLSERATVVQMAARSKAPRRTGCLQDSIVKRVEFGTPEGFVIRIVSDTTPCSPTRTSYSYWMETGTQPHNIPGAFGYSLPFGTSGRFNGMFHPGTRAYRFMRDALPLAVA
jgi:hypothetical protein